VLERIDAKKLIDGGRLNRVEITNAALPADVQLTGLSMECSRIYDLWLRKAILKECDIKYSMLERVNLRNAKLQQVDFTGTSFVNCDLSQAELSGCCLWYTRFDRCMLNYDSMLANLPNEYNLQTHVLRSLRLNASSEGDTRQANRLLLLELDSERRNLYQCFMHTSSYYRDRYKGVERALAFVHWLEHWAQRLAWGYGLRLKNLSVNIAILILVISLVIYSSGSTYNVGETDSARALNFSEAIYVTIITFCTVGFGDITPAALGGRVIASLTAVFGVIAWGFFVAAIYRRLAK
jgi:hypothetical protein